jgi:hypothetical protein
MYEHNTIEVFSLEEAKAVATKDARLVSSKTTYPLDNALTYYLLLNTWTLLWKNFAIHAWTRLKVQIMNDGLIPVINTMQEEAMRVVNEEDLGPWATVLYAEVRSGNPVCDRNLFDSAIGVDDTATVLFLLRYPKRFSPVDNDLVKEETLRDFLQTENRTKMLQLKGSYGYHYCAKILKDYIAEMYPWDEICDKIEQIEPCTLRFSSGAATDARATLGDKVKSVVNSGLHNDFQVDHFGVQLLDRPATAAPPCKRVSKVLAVPKSYKASRIIAMEDSYRNAFCQSVEDIFRAYDKRLRLINLEDQTINQKLACIGSVDGRTATLDASHASDLISKSLFCDAFPSRYVRLIMPYLPTHCDVKGVIRPLQMLSTSGHTLTFRHETIVYKGIAAVGVEYHRNITGEDYVPISHAYGDDTVVSSAAYDVVVHFFKRLGLIINEDKSYYQGSYRESCGKDYMDGMDVTSIYYPRFPIVGRMSDKRVSLDKSIYRDTYRGKIDNSLTMLIDLQKKLFPYSYDAARLVLSVVHAAYPSVTTSVAGTVCTDMWDYVDSAKRRIPTAYRLELIGPHKWPRFSKAVPIGPAAETLTGSNREAFERLAKLDTIHTYPQVAFRSDRSFSQKDVALYEYWKLTDFLRTGPEYDNDLDRLLGISKKPMSISEFFGDARLVLAKK